MIRFIDLSQEYWTDPECNGGPICAFLSTSSDQFLTNEDGFQVFSDIEEIAEMPDGQRLLRLVPKGFFER